MAVAALAALTLAACGGGGGGAGDTPGTGSTLLAVDSRYGTDGVATLALGTPWAPSLGIQPDGQLLVANHREVIPAPPSIYGGLPTTQAHVLQLDADGRRDAAFGQSGEARFTIKGYDAPVGVQVQASGRIVVAVSAHEPCSVPGYRAPCITAQGQPGAWHHTVVGLTPAGVLDTTFGTQGVASGLVSAIATPVQFTLQPDQRPLLLTSSEIWPLQEFTRTLQRFTVDGAPDTAFNQPPPTGTPPCEALGGAVLALPGGAIATAGGRGQRVYSPPETDPGLCVALHAAGTQAQTTGRWIALGEAVQEFQLQPLADGGFVLAARGCGTSLCRLSLVQFDAQGAPRLGLGQQGVVRVPLPEHFRLQTFATLPDGRMVAFGAVAQDPAASGPAARHRAAWLFLQADGNLAADATGPGLVLQDWTTARPHQLLRDRTGRWLVASTDTDGAGNMVLQVQRLQGTAPRRP